MFYEAFLARDVDAIVALYADDAVNHQVPEEPLHGKAEIRRGFERFFAAFPDERTNAVAFYETASGVCGNGAAGRPGSQARSTDAASFTCGRERSSCSEVIGTGSPSSASTIASRTIRRRCSPSYGGCRRWLATRKGDASSEEPFIRNCDVPEDFINLETPRPSA